MLHLKQKCSINMAPLIKFQNESIKNSSYAYLHCDLLYRVQLLSQSL
jgi:hypothetical protein